MSAWETLWKILGEEFADLADFEQTARAALRLLLAAALGAVLGYEREQSGKAAGLRTHMLVTLGAALFVMPLQLQSGGADALSRVIQGTVAGIGFLCAGTILQGRSGKPGQGPDHRGGSLGQHRHRRRGRTRSPGYRGARDGPGATGAACPGLPEPFAAIFR